MRRAPPRRGRGDEKQARAQKPEQKQTKARKPEQKQAKARKADEAQTRSDEAPTRGGETPRTPDGDATTVRPMWSGTISFGLVSVPVDLWPALQPGGVGLRMLAPDGTPLARRYFCPRENRDVHREHIQRGYEVGEGQYVVITDEELEALEPKKSRDIDLRRFVPAEAIDPLYFQRSYFLTPASDSNKAYRLLAAVMEKTARAGIATFVMRDKEYLVAIVAERGILRAETLRFADEIRRPEDAGLGTAAPAVQAVPAEVGRMERAIEDHSADELDPSELQDRQTPRLLELIRKKQERNEGVLEAREAPAEADEAAEDEEAAPADLVDVIRRSLLAAGK